MIKAPGVPFYYMLSIFHKKKKQSAVTFWTGNVTYKAMLTKEDVKFIFEQAEKMLKDSIDTSNIIAARTNTLITIITGSLIAFISYVITRLKNTDFDHLAFIGIAATAYLFVLAFLAFENTKQTSYLAPGSAPRDLLTNTIFDQAISKEERIIHLYISEYENYQFRIEKNTELNKKRWKRYDSILQALLFLPIGMLIIYLLT